MICIVPLAGPDFHSAAHGIKALWPVGGQPLIRAALDSRPWRTAGLLPSERIIFVMRRSAEADDLRQKLDDWFPGSQTVHVPALTGGALLSALAGTAMARAADEPVCIDLVDVLFDSEELVLPRFERPEVGGVLPWFVSDDPAFSYLDVDERGMVVRTAEKQVISRRASAGVYFFRDMPTWLSAAAFALAHRDTLAVRGIHFVCPAMNGVFAAGRRVEAFEVGTVRAVSKIFH